MESKQITHSPDGDGPGRDVVIEGHRYDGIREYDNPMPGWWVWMFVACTVFAIVYVPGLHLFDFIDSYEDDLAQGLEELAARRAAFAEQGGGFEVTEASLAAFIDDPKASTAGAATFAAYCAPCHGNEGQGLIGPNLTDEFWIHGADPTTVFEVITNGVTTKGMPSWEGSIAPEDRARLVAFVASIAGTEPANAKGPEGELIVR